MRIISINKDKNPHKISETDNLFMLNEHELKLSPADIYKNFPEERVLMLVHGYNSDYIRAYNAYRTIKQRLENSLDPEKKYETVGFAWPGGDSPGEYYAAKTRAKEIASRLTYHIMELYNHCGKKKIDIMCHSMGCLLTFEALKQIDDGIVGNLFATAAAIDNESIQKNEVYGVCIEKTEKTYVLYSDADSVLKYSYSIAELDRALGFTGAEKDKYVNKEKVRQLDCSKLEVSHNSYKTVKNLYKLINKSYDYQLDIPYKSDITDL